MKKIVGILMLFCAILTHNLSAQSKFEIVPHTGLMYQFLSLNRADSTLPAIPDVWQYVTLNLGGYGVIAHKNDVVSLGVDASINVGLNFNPPLSFLVQTPVYLMGRLGAGSTPYNEQNLGIGLGFGITPSYWNQKLGSPIDKMKVFSYSPGCVLEVNYMRTLVRVNFNVLSFSSHIKELDSYLGTTAKYKVSTVGLGFLYGF